MTLKYYKLFSKQKSTWCWETQLKWLCGSGHSSSWDPTSNEWSYCFHGSYHICFHLYTAGGDRLFSQDHDTIGAHQKNRKPKMIHCAPMCSQPVRSCSMAKLCFKELLQYQKSLMLPLIEKNCDATMSCVSLSWTIFSLISHNKLRLYLQWFCSSITMSMIITALQTKQKQLNFKEDLWGVKHIQTWLDESNQINLMFALTKKIYKNIQV